MKTTKKQLLYTLIFFVSVYVPITLNSQEADNNYLQKVLNNINKIESATYFEDLEAWQQGDTSALNKSCKFIKEFNNPNDSTIGASYVSLNCNDKKTLNFGYNGNIRSLVNHNNKEISIDNFTTRPLPFRPIQAPFFNYLKSIIQYCLSSKDNIKLNIKDMSDIYYIKLTIDMDKQVEFFGRPFYIDNPSSFGENTSIYEIWINKNSDLPYKIRREMSHDISIISCRDVELNTLNIHNFNLYSHFPKDYNVVQYMQSSNTQQSSDLIGKKAPQWTLNEMNGRSVSLSDINSKVVILNFTGIGCGPCKMAIPFLNKLKETRNINELEVISVESWQRKNNALINYARKNDIKYLFLQADDDILSKYEVGLSAPVFFILDQDRNIAKIIRGYNKDVTDNEIIQTIETLQ